MECLWLLTILVRKGVGDHGVEAILSEFRALLATTKLLEFYSFQRSWIQRPQLSRPEEEPKALHLTQGISSVSDTYLHSVLDAWYFSGIERYMLLWFEQHCPFDSVLTYCVGNTHTISIYLGLGSTQYYFYTHIG
jgi:hypothetical protein